MTPSDTSSPVPDGLSVAWCGPVGDPQNCSTAEITVVGVTFSIPKVELPVKSLHVSVGADPEAYSPLWLLLATMTLLRIGDASVSTMFARSV